MSVINSATVNGQTIVKTTTNSAYSYAVVKGDLAKVVRHRLNATIDSALATIAKECPTDVDAEMWDYINAPFKADAKKRIAKAQKDLAKISHFDDLAVVWSSASWHGDIFLAERAQRGCREHNRLVAVTHS